jgi:large subunit ribosomal protein L16
MLSPKKTKFQKAFNSNIYGLAHSSLVFGSFGIQAVTPGRLTSNQIEASRIVLSRFMKRQGSSWIRIFPYMPLTKKPNETRMGRGKGSVSLWYANIKVNQILFEFSSLDILLARELSRLISSKLPIKTKLIIKND